MRHFAVIIVLLCAIVTRAEKVQVGGNFVEFVADSSGVLTITQWAVDLAGRKSPIMSEPGDNIGQVYVIRTSSIGGPQIGPEEFLQDSYGLGDFESSGPSSLALTVGYYYAVVARSVSVSDDGNGGLAYSGANFNRFDFTAGDTILLASKTVRVSYTNDKNTAVTLRLVETSNPANILGEVIVAPGQSITEDVPLPSGIESATVLIAIPDTEFTDGTGWEVLPGVTEIIETGVSVDTRGDADEIAEADVPTNEGVPETIVKESPGQSIWHVNTTTTTDDERLDKATYKEGVNKLTAGLENMRQEVKRLREEPESDQTELALRQGAESVMDATASAIGQAENYFNESYDNMENAMGIILEGRGEFTNPDPSIGPGDPGLVYEYMSPANGELITVVADPSKNESVLESVKGLLAWFRAMLAWTAVAWLIHYMIREIRKSIGTVFLTQTQARPGAEAALQSNPLTGGFSLTMRIAIFAILAGILLGMPAVMVALYSTQWDLLLETFVAEMGGAQSSAGPSIFTVASNFVPVSTLFAVFMNYLFFEFAILPTQVIWQFAIRVFPV